MVHKFSWRVGAAVVSTALLVSGCGMFGEDEPEDRESLDSIFGLSGDATDWRDNDTKIQDLVAACMQEKGWEYIPVIYPDDWYDYEWDPSNERERIAREGFGIAYWALYPDAGVDYDMGPEFTDPNDAYRESLTPEELDAYYADLHGDMRIFSEGVAYEEVYLDDGSYIDDEWIDDEWIEEPGWGGGCQGEASEAVYGEADSTDVWEVMSVYYEELELRVQADPRMLELNEAWVKCMADEGFDYESQEDFWTRGWEELYERFDEVSAEVYYDPMAGWTEQEMQDFWDTATEADWDALYANQTHEISDETRAFLEDLLADEIKLALADHDCSTGHWEKSTEIWADIEDEYIRENREALEAAAAQLKG